MQTTETDRLILEPMTSRYVGELHGLHTDTDVMAVFDSTYSYEHTIQTAKDNEKHIEDYGFGLWCFFLKETGEFVGRGGVRYQTLDNGFRFLEVAYMLHKRFWRQGLATEIGKYSIKYALHYLNTPEVRAITPANHTASLKVISKIGMEFLEDTVIFRGTECKMARITKEEYFNEY